MERRSFIGKSALAIGAGLLGLPVVSQFTTSQQMAHQTKSGATMVFGNVKVHCFTSGYVKVKQSHKDPSLGLPAILIDPFWTDWLPIHTWVIEHPEGNILIDTGENKQVNEKGYFACDKINGAVYRTILRFSVNAEDELPSLLANINMTPEDIRWVVLTHLHLDHVDGAQFFSQSEFVINKTEYKVNSPGHLRCLLPNWFRPSTIDYTKSRLPGFDQSFALTKSKDVLLIPTPGHTYGHQSVVLDTGQQFLVFAGDASFNQQQVLDNKVAGVCSDKKQARQTIERFRLMGMQHPTVYLPSHDPQSRDRFLHTENMRVLQYGF